MKNCMDTGTCEVMPETIRATELKCPKCGCKHTFSGYTEGKNIVRCPNCNKVHNILKTDKP